MNGKVLSPDDVAGELRSGMTIGIGGWGSRRKPMALVRAMVRSGLTDLTIVSYGGPDVGLLMATGRVRRVVCGFVTLDTIPLEPHFRLGRQAGTIELTELDEGMMHWGLLAAAHRLPFLPIRAGLGSDVPRVNPDLRAAARAVAAQIAAKNPAVIRLAKQSLNGIDPVDVKRSYRYEQGFTFELNLTGVSDEARQAFLDRPS